MQVAVKDSLGNTVTNPAYAITIGKNPVGGTLSGTLTVNTVNGVAVFPNLSIDLTGTGYALTASSVPALTGATSNAFAIVSSSANRLAFITQPSNPTTAGVTMTPAVQVEVRDQFGNRVTTASDSITVAIGVNPAGGTLSGTTTVNAASGVATFSGLSIDKSGVGYTLPATGAGLLSATSNSFAINAAAATKLGFVVQPSNATAGDLNSNPNPIIPAVQVAVQDAFGNTVTSDTGTSITVAIGTNPPGNGALTGTMPVGTVNGVATFSDLNIDKVGVGYTLTASGGGYPNATSVSFNIVADFPDHLGFIMQPSTTTAGASIFPAVEVAVQDVLNNTVSTATDAITMSKASGPGGGVLSGTLTQNAVNGVAFFGDLYSTTAGTNWSLGAAATGLNGATSNLFTISAGSGDHLDFTVQPRTTMAGVAISPAVQVSVRDSGNNAVSSTALITISFGNNPGGATLTGTTSVNAV
ncbi:MAG: hemagglutinin, partial [Planctomycetota bacterium]|nr:hemagglutinin [Planctomycetota bacterium]